jgi:hypothetical protein
MSGIGNYFHGETGRVADLCWVADENLLTYEMKLFGDPHREVARDYNSDISIDPALKPGDQAVFIRMNAWTGVWVTPENRFSPQLESALDRAGRNRETIRKYIDLTGREVEAAISWAEESLPSTTQIPVRVRNAAESTSERPATAASIFLSYSSRNALVARQIYEHLKADAKADIWFALTKPGEAPAHRAAIEGWLDEAIYECEVFLLLLTQASADSRWVKMEVASAAAKEERWGQDSHLVCLNLEGVRPPDQVPSEDIIDCRNLSVGEILEELYGAVYKRDGRRKWLDGQRKHGWREELPNRSFEYWHLQSDGGVADALKVDRQRGRVHWVLDYSEPQPDGSNVSRRAEGLGENAIVDLGIRSGDCVGFFMFLDQIPLWMRSSDLTLDPFDVKRRYDLKLRSPSGAVRLCNILLAIVGLAVVAAITLIVFDILRPEATGEPLFGVDSETSAGLVAWMRLLITANVATTGLYQVVSYAHPYQFENRSLWSALVYSGRALFVTAAVTLVHPLTYGLPILIVSGITMGLVVGVIAKLAGTDPIAAVLQGVVLAYAAWVLYVLYRLGKLFKESPEYLSRPRFFWI